MVHSEPPPRAWPLPQPLQGQVSRRQPRTVWPLGSHETRQDPAQVVVCSCCTGRGAPTAARGQGSSPAQEALGFPAWGFPFRRTQSARCQSWPAHGCGICRVWSAPTARTPERVSVRSVVTLGPGWRGAGCGAVGPWGQGSGSWLTASLCPQHRGYHSSWSLCSGTTGPT